MICPVPFVNLEPCENLGFADRSSTLSFDAQHLSRAGRCCVGQPQIASGAPIEERRAPAPARRPAALGEAAETDPAGSSPLGLAIRDLGGLALRPCHRQTGDCDRLASERFPTFLDVEDPTRPDRAAGRAHGGPRTDSHHEPAESSVRSSAHPRRTAQAGYRHRRDQRRRVYRAQPSASIADLADIPRESPDLGVGRFL